MTRKIGLVFAILVPLGRFAPTSKNIIAKIVDAYKLLIDIVRRLFVSRF